MKTHRMQAFLYVVMVALLTVQPARAAASAQEGTGDLILATQAGGAAAKEIRIVFADTSSSEAAYHIYLRNQGGDDLTGVTLHVANVRKSEGDELAEGYSITFTSNGEDLPDGGLTIPAGGQVHVRLDLANFTGEGTFTGELVVEAESAVQASAPLLITRVPEPDLGIAGFSDTGIELAQLTNNHIYTFTIYSRNTTSVDDLQVSVDNFVIEGGEAVTPTVELLNDEGKPLAPVADTQDHFPIVGLDAIHVQVTLDIPEEGDYSSNINLAYNGQRVTYPIKVTRSRPAVSVEILGLDNPVTVTTDDASFWMVLSENKGRALTVNPPTLLDLNRKQDETTSPQALYTGIELRERGSNDALMGSLAMQGREPRWLNLKINGLEPGEYAGILEVGNADGVPVRKDIKILVREPGLNALFWIAASIVLSILAKELLPRLQRKTQFRIEIAEQRLDLANLRKNNRDLDEKEDLLLVKLEQLLLTLRDREDDILPEMTTELKNIQSVLKHFPHFIDLRRSISGLPSTHEAELNDAREGLLEDLEKDPSRVGTVPDRLKQIKTKLLEQLKGFATPLIDGDETFWFPENAEGKSDWEAEKKAFLGRIPGWELHGFTDIVRKFWDGYARYLQATARILLRHHKKLKEAHYKTAKTKLEEVADYFFKEIGEQEVEKLRSLYQEARQIYTLKQSELHGLTELELAKRSIDRDVWFVRNVPSEQSAAIDPATDRARLRAMARGLRWSIYGIAVLVAIVSGYAVLYLNNFTWGSDQDHIIALLWGLGLFEVSNASLSGMTGMNKFGGVFPIVTGFTNPDPPQEPTTP